jgi:hypothetical protein
MDKINIFCELSWLADKARSKMDRALSSAKIANQLIFVVPDGDPAAQDLNKQKLDSNLIYTSKRGSGLQFALNSARKAQADLLVMLGETLPSKNCINTMQSELNEDPHFGFAVPRTGAVSANKIFPLFDPITDGEDEIDVATLSQGTLGVLPSKYIITEFFSDCVLIKHQALEVLPDLPFSNNEDFSQTIFLILRQLRQRGYRGIISNRAVATNLSPRKTMRLPGEISRLYLRSREHLGAVYHDIAKSSMLFDAHFCHRLEAVLIDNLAEKPTIVIDAFGVPAAFNGTSIGVMAFCKGIHAQNKRWNVVLQMNEEAADFHNASDLFPDFKIENNPKTKGLVALRLSQPWGIADIKRNHENGFWNIFAILDTIAWDILEGSPLDIDEAWHLIARNSDAIIYLSKYTQDRFNIRFPVSKNVEEFVYYHSFHPKDHRIIKEDTINTERSILIVGNHYPHKNIAESISYIGDAFPLTKISVLGQSSIERGNINYYSSGALPEEQIEGLFLDSTIVVFPSLYEGFGFPIFKALSYGKTLVARDSPLLREMISLYRGPGRVVTFDSYLSLIEVIGKIFANEVVEELPLSLALPANQEPKDWNALAVDLLSFIENKFLRPVTKEDVVKWIERDRILSHIERFQ